MFSSLRSRATYANVAATLALLFAMSGGAYAASKFLITSTKQISPKVLKQLKGNSGKNGAAGSQGLAGTEGKQGPEGKQGAEGKQGTAGNDGANGKDGVGATTVSFSGKEHGCEDGGVVVKSAGPETTVCNGQTGFTETLPSGKSERGVWSFGTVPYVVLSGKVRSEEEVEFKVAEQFVPISFTIPLKEPLAASNVIYVTHEEETEDKVPANCGGTVAEPLARKGFLCIYGFASNDKFEEITPSVLNPEGNPHGTPAEGAGVSGTLLNFTTVIGGDARGRGVWVLTAP